MFTFKKLFRANWIAFSVFTLMTSLATILLSGFSCRLSDMEKIYKNSTYDASGYLPRDTFVEKNCYYSNLSYISFYCNEEALFTNSLMCKNNVVYIDTHFVKLNGKEVPDASLNMNECCISKNTAKDYSISIGDSIIVKTTTSVEYKVKYLFENFYGLDEPNYFDDEHLIILGENSNILENLNSYSTYVLAGQNFIFTGGGALTSRQNTISKLKTYNAVIYSSFSLYFAIWILIICVISKDLDVDYKSNFLLGLKSSSIKKTILNDCLLKWTIMFLPTLMLYSIITLIFSTFSVSFMCFMLTAFVVSFGTTFLVYIFKINKLSLGGKKYE